MTSLRTSSDYDRFARVYNLHWGSYAMRVVPILEHLVLRHLPEQAAVMDLCCGTGQLAARLSEGSEGTPTAKGRWGLSEGTPTAKGVGGTRRSLEGRAGQGR